MANQFDPSVKNMLMAFRSSTPDSFLSLARSDPTSQVTSLLTLRQSNFPSSPSPPQVLRVL